MPAKIQREGTGLADLIRKWSNNEACRDLLEELRWPDGPVCPRCECVGATRVKGRDTLDCNACHHQFSVRVGTVLQDSKLPLSTWFLATYMMVESRKGISSNQLKRMLDVSYKTAWFLTHRIRGAMGMVAQAPLTGVVEVDETYVGGQTGRHGRRGPQADKVIVAGAIERGGEIRLRVVNDVRKRTLTKVVSEVVDLDGADAVYSDKLASYVGIHPNHDSVNHNQEEWVRGDVHTQTVESAWSLLKRSIVGSYHQLSARHLPSYLDEMEWRFNNRENPHLFRDTLRVIVTSSPLLYSELVE